MIKIEANKEQLDALKVRGKAARELLKQDGVAMRQIAVFLDQWVQRNFKGIGEKVGGWERYKYGGRLVRKAQANAQSVDGKRYIDGSAQLLQNTGALRLSFLPFVRLGTAGIGSDLPYSEFHEHGTDILPQRRMLPENADVDADVKEIMENWIKVTIRKMLP